MNSKGVVNRGCVIDGTNIANGDIATTGIADTCCCDIVGNICNVIDNICDIVICNSW